MISAIAAALVLFVLQLMFRHKPKPLPDYDQLVLLNAYKYNIYEVFALVPLFFFLSLICYFFYSLGNDVHDFLFAKRVSDFSIYPPDTYWLLPGLCFGFGLIMTPMDLLYRLLLRNEYPVYIEYTNRKHGYNGFKAIRPLCICFTTAGLVTSVLGLDWFTEIKGDRILIDEFAALTTREYGMEEVVSVTHYEKDISSDGQETVDPHHKIIFFDGYVWDTSSDLREVKHEKYRAVAEYFASRANIQISYQLVDAD